MTTSTIDRIRVRAYFHQFFEDLGRRVDFIRSLYRRHRIALKPGEGFALALDEAEALAKGVKTRAFSAQKLNQTVHDAHVIYALGESLLICVDAGLDVRNHLANLTT